MAEIDNLRESQRQDLRMRIKYPDQNIHLVVPRLRDLKRVFTENEENGKFILHIYSKRESLIHLTIFL